MVCNSNSYLQITYRNFQTSVALSISITLPCNSCNSVDLSCVQGSIRERFLVNTVAFPSISRQCLDSLLLHPQELSSLKLQYVQ